MFYVLILDNQITHYRENLEDLKNDINYNNLSGDIKFIDYISFNDFDIHPDWYIWNEEKIILKSKDEIEKIEQQKEQEKINMLKLTKREVFLALYKDKGITPEQIRNSITDEEALIEFDYANDYYRGNPLINEIGEKLGYTTEELDYLFQNGEFSNENEKSEVINE